MGAGNSALALACCDNHPRPKSAARDLDQSELEAALASEAAAEGVSGLPETQTGETLVNETSDELKIAQTPPISPVVQSDQPAGVRPPPKIAMLAAAGVAGSDQGSPLAGGKSPASQHTRQRTASGSVTEEERRQRLAAAEDRRFEVVLARIEGGDGLMGFKCESIGHKNKLMITELNSEGAGQLSRWNAAHPDLAVKAEDFIETVNGKSGVGATLMKNLKDAHSGLQVGNTLKLGIFRRGVPLVAGDLGKKWTATVPLRAGAKLGMTLSDHH